MDERCERSYNESRFEPRQADDLLNKTSDHHDARLNNLDLNNWRSSSASVDGSYRVKKRNQEQEMKQKDNANQRLDRTQDERLTVHGRTPSRHRAAATGSVGSSFSNVMVPLNSRRQAGSVIAETDCNYLVTRLMKLRECIKEATKASEKYSKRLDSYGIQQFSRLNGLVKQLKEEEDLCLTSLQRSLTNREINISKQERDNPPDVDVESDIDNSSRQEQDQDLDQEINSSFSETEEQFYAKQTNNDSDLHSLQRSAFSGVSLNQQGELLKCEAELRGFMQHDGPQQRNDRNVRASSLGVLTTQSGRIRSLEELHGTDKDDTGSTRLKSRYVCNEVKNKIPERIFPSSDLNQSGMALLSPPETQRLEKLNEKNKHLHSMIRKLHSLQQERLLLKNELASSISDVWGNAPDSNSAIAMSRSLDGCSQDALNATDCNVDVTKLLCGRAEDAVEFDEESLREMDKEGVVTGDMNSISEFSNVGNAENGWPFLTTSDHRTLVLETMASEIPDKNSERTTEKPKQSFHVVEMERKSKSSKEESGAKQCLEVLQDEFEPTVGLQEKLSQLKQAKEMMANLTQVLAFTDLPSGSTHGQSSSRVKQRPSSALLPNSSEKNDESCEDFLRKFRQDESEFAQLLELSKSVCEQEEELKKLQNAFDKDEREAVGCKELMLDETAAATAKDRSSCSVFNAPSFTNYLLPLPRVSERTETMPKNPFETAVSNELVFDHGRKQPMHQEELLGKEFQRNPENESFKSKTQICSTQSSCLSFTRDALEPNRMNPAANVTMATWCGSSPSNFENTGLFFSKLNETAQSGDTVSFKKVDKETEMVLPVFDDPVELSPRHVAMETVENLSRDAGLDKELEHSVVDSHAWDTAIGNEISASECADCHGVHRNRSNTDKSEHRLDDLSTICKEIESLKTMVNSVALSLRERSSPGEEHQLQKNQLFIGLNQCLFQLMASQNSMTERINQLEKVVYRLSCRNMVALEQFQHRENSTAKNSKKHLPKSALPRGHYVQCPASGRERLESSESAEREFLENRCSSTPNNYWLQKGKHTSGRNYSSKPSSLLSSSHRNQRRLDGNVTIKTIEATNSGLVDKIQTALDDATARLDSRNAQKCGKPRSGIFTDPSVARKTKTSSLSVTSDSYDELISSDSASGVAQGPRVTNEGIRTESTFAPHDRSSFEFLKETIYSEVATLVTLNEHCPHYLIRLFQELQLLSSDLLRQKALHAIQNISAKDSLATSSKQDVDQNQKRQKKTLKMNLEAVQSNNLDAKFDYLEEEESSGSMSASKGSTRGHEAFAVESNNDMVESFTDSCHRRNFESDCHKSDESAQCDNEDLDFVRKQTLQMRSADLRSGKGHSMTSSDKWRMAESDLFNSIQSNMEPGNGNFQRTNNENQTENDIQLDSDD